jgi:multidrug efflux pump
MIYTQNSAGGMVPLASLMDVQRINGPDTSAIITSIPRLSFKERRLPGVSSGQAIERMERICRENLPSQFSFEWTQLTYQEVIALE